MSYLTLVAKVEARAAEREVLPDAMLCATKVYNGLMGALREEDEQTGKSQVSRKKLNRILKEIPRAKVYYSQSVEVTRDDVIGAYHPYFALRQAGYSEARPPGFRRKSRYSELRYFDGYGFKLGGDRLTATLELERMDGVRQVSVRIRNRPGVMFRKAVSVLLAYDERRGIEAHLVVDMANDKAKGTRQVGVDLGETVAIYVLFDDGHGELYSGREIKAIHCYWQKVRTKVKPPIAQNWHKPRRFQQIEQKESRQVNHLIHLLTRNFVGRCWETGVNTFALGDLTVIRAKRDYDHHLNQRLHACPFAKIAATIEYKARLNGIQVIQISEAYSSCNASGPVSRTNRKSRGAYTCLCGWFIQADLNAAANLFQTTFNVSLLKRSNGEWLPLQSCRSIQSAIRSV